MANKKKDKRSALQKIGGHTLFPYALKAAGFDEVATKMGYPEHFSESVKDDAKKKKRMAEEKRTDKRIIKASARRRTRDHNTEPKQDIKSALGLAGGGKVCRGMGAATQGGKFRIS